MFEFTHPWVLFSLVIVPLLIVWYLRWSHKREGSIRFSSLSLIRTVSALSGKRKVNFLNFLTLSIILLLVLALARPRITSKESESSWDVVDIMLVLDISGSMRAEDFKPNRLEAAKLEALDFVSSREHDRIGLVVFAGESYLQCPLTVDNDVVTNILKQVTIIDEQHDGTAIGMALAMGINRLRDSEVKNKVIVLLSDGSNNAGELDPITAARMATDYDITIHTIGIGRNGKVPFPTVDPFTGRKRLIYQEMEIDEETLLALSKETSGQFSLANDREGLSVIFDELDKLERTEVSVTDYTDYREIFAWFLFPAVALAVSDRFIRQFWFRKRN
ncbi:MAG: VWA domain-containing protein [Candidatus Marinimicrobia bacterium]|jgi:Ca-activated chloride channel family protein|nr:VWA domain-containing protein [Candidatus Neomarinimicrobiota bacterium]MDP6568197.1 VWA domain-containing protein [Candidatus Neomarinimicrobiota bacterium]MDP7025397.1 VWA domain-containing protein [Candidatus Neomarinimicrobiota bacterium]